MSIILTKLLFGYCTENRLTTLETDANIDVLNFQHVLGRFLCRNAKCVRGFRMRVSRSYLFTISWRPYLSRGHICRAIRTDNGEITTHNQFWVHCIGSVGRSVWKYILFRHANWNSILYFSILIFILVMPCMGVGPVLRFFTTRYVRERLFNTAM